MPEDNRTIITGHNDRLAPALAALKRLDDLENKRQDVENGERSRRLLEESLGLCDQALRIFRSENETWLAGWTALHKAALLCELAHDVDTEVRSVHLRTALELAQGAVHKAGEDPAPDLGRLARLYTTAVDVLFRVRGLLDQEEAVTTLDNLIRQLGSRLGEIQALDLTMRSEAYDLLYSAQMLDSLTPLEEDPVQREEMRKTSRSLALDAYDRLRVSSPATLAPLLEFLKQLEKPSKQETEILLPQCPRCGAANTGGASFCSSCGATLARASFHQELQPANICRRCDHTNREDALFCTYCGARLRREA